MEQLAIEIGLTVGINGAKFLYDHREDIKNFISKHKYKMCV
jgi:hypothetical protein